MNKIKSNYIIKEIILQYLPLKRLLLLFKTNRRYRQLFQLYPSIYELYVNIKNDFEPYNEHIENEMLSYIVHFSRLQKHLPDQWLIEYYFRFLLSQKIILAEYDNIHFGKLLNYLNTNKYKGTLIIKLGEPKLDLSIRPNIEIKGENILLEIYFNMKWVDREKQDNIEYIKSFLEQKIIGEKTKNVVKKIHFGEYLNLSDEKYENIFFELLSSFPNALFNIQSNYFDDIDYWRDLDRFFKLKFIIEEKLDENTNKKEDNNAKKTKLNINIIQDNNNIKNPLNIHNKKINSISKYYKEKKLNKKRNDENKNSDLKLFNNINNEIQNEIKNFNKEYPANKEEVKNSTENINLNFNKNNHMINNETILTNNNCINNKNFKKNKESKEITIENKKNFNDNIRKINNEFNENKIINYNSISNEKNSELVEDEFSMKIKRLNRNILSIKELNNFIIDFRKNKISVAKEFFKIFEKNPNEIINRLPSKLTLINFRYEQNKEYFSELNNKIQLLIIVQRIYRNTPYPFYLSQKLNSLIALKLERINILEENLVSVINNNPNLEIFEIHKNYTGYVFGYNLALALSQLKNLKSLITEFFWYKEYVPNFKTSKLVNRQENEFFKFLTSNSIKYLSLSNETNININTLNQNLPNLISLSLEYSNILKENNDDENNINNKDDNFSKKRIFNRRRSIKKINSSLIQTNYLKDFNYSEKDRLFHKLRDLTIVKIENSDEFFKRMAFFNKLENLYIDYYDTTFFETFVNYGHHLNNLDMLFISPDYGEKIKPVDSEHLVKAIHHFKKLTYLEIGFYCINEELINLLFDELTKLPLLQQLEIRVDISSEENKEMIQNKINQLKTKNCNSKYLTITYIFNDKRYKI